MLGENQRPTPKHGPKGLPSQSTDPHLTTVMRPLTDRFQQLKRDVSMVVDGLRGRPPAPFTERCQTDRDAQLLRLASQRAVVTRTVTVDEVIHETPDAVTLRIVDAAGAPLSFVPGQFFTLLVDIDGDEVRRAYSASSDANERGSVCVTIKRIAGGRVSTFINERVKPGDTLRLLGPSGSFIVEPDDPEHIVLIAGGSGITPMMSILRTQLGTPGTRRFDLVFGNRGEADIIFRRDLEALAAEHPDRLRIRHVLSNPPDEFEGRAGLLTSDVLNDELNEWALPDQALFMVCGPEPMMDAARKTLAERGVDKSRIREERFTQPHLRTSTKARITTPQPVTVTVDGKAHDVRVLPGQTLLDAGLATGAPMPYSCTMGGCGACRCKLKRGHVEMDEPNCLDEGERAEGYVLACIARPTEPSAVEID